jgi:hypothetical protein
VQQHRQIHWKKVVFFYWKNDALGKNGVPRGFLIIFLDAKTRKRWIKPLLKRASKKFRGLIFFVGKSVLFEEFKPANQKSATKKVMYLKPKLEDAVWVLSATTEMEIDGEKQTAQKSSERRKQMS